MGFTKLMDFCNFFFASFESWTIWPFFLCQFRAFRSYFIPFLPIIPNFGTTSFCSNFDPNVCKIRYFSTDLSNVHSQMFRPFFGRISILLDPILYEFLPLFWPIFCEFLWVSAQFQRFFSRILLEYSVPPRKKLFLPHAMATLVRPPPPGTAAAAALGTFLFCFQNPLLLLGT